MGAPDPIASIASDVADGRSVDWADAEAQLDADELETLAQLRILAAIAQAHDQPGLEADDPAALGTPAAPGHREALFTWGPLRALERLGQGSFGEVFRAWDPSLAREVALKLLKPGRADQAPRADAVIREGQLLARVRHPNVMAVYGATTHDGRIGIWSELLTGRTLADIVIEDGPLGAQEASLYGEAVCRALTAVHLTGLLHRDVKAQNVIRETGGRIVLMDFGLGREADARPAGASGRDVAGTPVYLAPEIFDGAAPSARSDVYAVGVLLFHLVTGSFPVTGDTLDEIVETHARRKVTRLHDVRSDLPTPFVDVVERALAPNPVDRFESAGALQQALARTSVGVAEPDSPARRGRGVVASISAAVAALAVAGLAALFWPALPSPAPVVLNLSPPPGLTFTPSARNVPTISPDGQRVAFVASDSSGTTQLWVRRLLDTQATPIAGSQSASGQFWSPDSQSLGFFSAVGLHRVSLSGARSEVLVRMWENRGAAWGPDGQLLVAQGPGVGLSRLAVAGDALVPVTRVDRARGEHAHMWPQFLPDGRFIFFVLSDQERVRGIYLGSLDGRSTRLVPTDSAGVYAAGSLYFVRDSTLFAQPLDLTRGAMSAAPVVVATQVGVSYHLRPVVTVSETGTIIYGPRARDYRRLAWHDMDGRELSVLAPPDKFRNPTLSRDGRYLAIEWYDALSEVRVFDLARGGWRTLNIGFRGQLPAFGPGHELALGLSPRGTLDLFRLDLDGNTFPRPVVSGSVDFELTDWSPDGSRLAYSVVGERGMKDVWTASADGSSSAGLLTGAYHEVQAHFSPDGRSLAYASNETGRTEIYVQTPWDGGRHTVVSTAGGYDPVWRTNDELLYLDPSGGLMSATVPSSSSGGAAAAPRRLFKTGVDTPGASRNNYVLHPDKDRVLISSPSVDSASASFVVLLNWREMAGTEPAKPQP
jgi:serine/threonine protein kinase